MTDYSEQRAWSDMFLPTVKRVVGPYLLEPASFEHDTQEATDLILIQARDLRIACRIRKKQFGNHDAYKWQFTMRSTSSGHTTELQKIVNGFGDWMFYGFGDDETLDIFRWYLIDLSAWRAHMIRNRSLIICGSKPNPDGKTGFTWFDIRSFPPTPSLLIASSHDIESPVIEPVYTNGNGAHA